MLQAGLAFTPGAGTTVDGNSGGNAVGVLPGLSLFYVHGLGKDLKVGFGVASTFGLGMSYNSGWVGRYYALDNTLVGISMLPGLSLSPQRETLHWGCSERHDRLSEPQ